MKAKKTKTKTKLAATRARYSKADIKALKAHSKAKTPLSWIMAETGRTESALRQKALRCGFGLGHQR